MLSGEDRTTSISEEVALAETSFEELHNSIHTVVYTASLQACSAKG